MQLEQILKVAVRGGASDIILKVGVAPRFRFNGDLVPLADGGAVTAEVMDQWIQQILPPHLEQHFRDTGDADFAYQLPQGNRFRVNIFKQRQMSGVVLRVISSHIRTLEELQLPAVLKKVTQEKRGLILITGSTGSGKSTTLAAMMQRINQDRAAHIVTIEDPVEFHFQDAKSVIEQREIGIDTKSFGTALRAALRQNPDVILVGELRDRETVETALMAADTGHLVMSTLHTLDAVETMNRILSFVPPASHPSFRLLLANTLRAVISQRLVPRANGRGSVAAMEVLINTATTKDVITAGSSFDALHDAIEQGGHTYGMQSFDQHLFELFQQGLVTREETLRQASNPNDMDLRLRGVVS